MPTTLVQELVAVNQKVWCVKFESLSVKVSTVIALLLKARPT